MADELAWQVKEGKTWVKFAKLLRKECEAKLSSNTNHYLSTSEVTRIVDIAADFRRLRVAEDWDWEPSTLNGQVYILYMYIYLLINIVIV